MLGRERRTRKTRLYLRPDMTRRWWRGSHGGMWQVAVYWWPRREEHSGWTGLEALYIIS